MKEMGRGDYRGSRAIWADLPGKPCRDKPTAKGLYSDLLITKRCQLNPNSQKWEILGRADERTVELKRLKKYRVLGQVGLKWRRGERLWIVYRWNPKPWIRLQRGVCMWVSDTIPARYGDLRMAYRWIRVDQRILPRYGHRYGRQGLFLNISGKFCAWFGTYLAASP